MNPLPEPSAAGIASFRVKLALAMMLVVCAVTGLGLWLAQRGAEAAVERDLRRGFQERLAVLRDVQDARHAALVERCRALVRKPRIHAALEDDALDLLYPSAEDELRDVMEADDGRANEGRVLHARFYRFLDVKGAVIPPPEGMRAGELRPEESARLALQGLPDKQQLGYLERVADGPGVSEVVVTPIISSETGETIAALALGFKPVDPGEGHAPTVWRGIWLSGRLHPDAHALEKAVTQALAGPGDVHGGVQVQIEGVPHLLFHRPLNPGSLFPAAQEVCVYPLTELDQRRQQLRWQVGGAGGLLLLGGFVASHLLARRFSRPVEKLAVVSEENRARRLSAEAALEVTNKGLQRAARFSADASHQLKTPVTVLRAGLEELLARSDLEARAHEEVAALIHQTYRLTSVIEDLLLLSRMDAGRLELEFAPVDLTRLVEACQDDLDALPDGLEVSIETDFQPPVIHIAGEKRYTMLILQNLLENARKYNLPGGCIRITAREEGGSVRLTVGNTGRPIPPALREHMFERFHRGEVGENIPGYGLGLNLARELARIHHGDLRLARSDAAWTEFEVTFQRADPPA